MKPIFRGDQMQYDIDFDKYVGELERELATTKASREGMVLVPRAWLISSKREHRYCEDSFYNCAAHEETWIGRRGACNCGADEFNSEIDKLLATAEGGK